MTYLEVLVSIAGLIFGYVVVWAFTTQRSENDPIGTGQEEEREPEDRNFEGSEKEEAFKKDEPTQNEGGDIGVRVFSCPTCEQRNRVRVPLPKGTVKCAKCKNQFIIYVDQLGNLYITETTKDREKSDKEIELDTAEKCLTLLGLTRSASPQEIRSAYRAKIRKYHPDKVSHLGEKLRSLADYESKRLNHAYSLLNDQGYINEA